ncbi:hypothetical protein [Teichococcus deserti]|uniref:hypothetical protein n=1 Tax=Teichococcus deserti TaxID=1817963 RepID=UPI001F60638C|nr:hypothetical protein [Pseudoroseomonas deserti]
MPRVIWSMLFSIAVRVSAALVAIVLVAAPAAGAAAGREPVSFSAIAAAGAAGSVRGAASTAATPWLTTSATVLASEAMVAATSVLAADSAGAGSFGAATRAAGFGLSVSGLVIFGALAMQLLLLCGRPARSGIIRDGQNGAARASLRQAGPELRGAGPVASPCCGAA